MNHVYYVYVYMDGDVDEIFEIELIEVGEIFRVLRNVNRGKERTSYTVDFTNITGRILG